MDDAPGFADLTATFLQRIDDRFEVETATHPDKSLDRLTERDFDGIMSDFEMPKTDGIALLRTVRGRDPDLPFILFTGRG